MIKVHISGNRADVIEREPLTSGTVGKVINFAFTEDWRLLIKYAVFEGSGRRIALTNIGDSCIIPHEVLAKHGGALRVGVYGRTADGSAATPTVYAQLGIIQRGADPNADPSTKPTLPVWAQIQAQIGDMAALETEAKDSLVAAINEAAKSGGGGISTTAKNLLIMILRSGVYTADQSDNIAALETALGGGTTEPEEPDVPVEKTYSISNELINCTSSNLTTSVKKNAAYSTTLTANDGYTLTGGPVTVTMGGVDITSTAYADGVISIATVTGDVEIFASAVAVQAEAALPEDGLISYFDFRTTTYNNAGSSGSTTIAPTKGSGQLYAWANDCISAQNEYGLRPAKSRQWQYDQNGGTNQTALGNAFTVIQLTYGEVPVFGFNYTNILPYWMFRPKYINASGSTTDAAAGNGNNFNSDSKQDYNFTVFRADGATLTEIFDTSRTTYNGGDIDGFSRWLDTPYGNIANIEGTKYCTAMAIYNRALTDSEIEAAREFMNTLEVTA